MSNTADVDNLKIEHGYYISAILGILYIFASIYMYYCDKKIFETIYIYFIGKIACINNICDLCCVQTT